MAGPVSVPGYRPILMPGAGGFVGQPPQARKLGDLLVIGTYECIAQSPTCLFNASMLVSVSHVAGRSSLVMSTLGHDLSFVRKSAVRSARSSTPAGIPVRVWGHAIEDYSNVVDADSEMQSHW